MKPADWINLGQLGTSIAGGVAAGGAASRASEQAEFDRMRQERADEFTRQLQYYQMQQQARSGLGAFYNQANMDRATGRQALLNASPLGAEQELAYQMARARGLSGVAENFRPVMPTSADIAGLIRPTTNMLGAFTTPDFRQTISPEATARSIAERRKALAGVDPTFQFGSMGDYGLPNLEKEVAAYAQGVAADRLSRENLLQDLLLQQTKAAAAFPQTVAQAQGMQGVPPSQTAQTQKPKKNSWWKKVLNVAATAAPIVAAPFTGGTSLALIGAGAGALKGALSGGAKGALTGAAMGAATSAIGGGAAGAAAKRGAGEAASAAIKRAILNPRALTQLGGAAIGGQAEQLAQMASPFLPGATAFKPGIVPGFENQMPPGFQGPQQPIVGPGAEGFSTEFTSPAPSLPSRPTTQGLVPFSSNLIQRTPPVTPRLVPTKSMPHEQVGRSRTSPPFMYANGAAPDALTKATGIGADPSSKAAIERNLGLPYYMRGQQPTPTMPMGEGPLAAGQPDILAQVADTPIGMAMLSALGMPFRGAGAAAARIPRGPVVGPKRPKLATQGKQFTLDEMARIGRMKPSTSVGATGSPAQKKAQAALDELQPLLRALMLQRR